jgi:hypothetical protein
MFKKTDIFYSEKNFTREKSVKNAQKNFGDGTVCFLAYPSPRRRKKFALNFAELQLFSVTTLAGKEK